MVGAELSCVQLSQRDRVIFIATNVDRELLDSIKRTKYQASF